MILKTFKGSTPLDIPFGPAIEVKLDSKEKVFLFYTLMYYYADAILNKFKFCDVQKGICLRHRMRKGENFCCTFPGCDHLGKEGCKVMSLGCKLWLCIAVQGRSDRSLEEKKAINELVNLKFHFQEMGLITFRGTRENDVERCWRSLKEHKDFKRNREFTKW